MVYPIFYGGFYTSLVVVWVDPWFIPFFTGGLIHPWWLFGCFHGLSHFLPGGFIHPCLGVSMVYPICYGWSYTSLVVVWVFPWFIPFFTGGFYTSLVVVWVFPWFIPFSTGGFIHPWWLFGISSKQNSIVSCGSVGHNSCKHGIPPIPPRLRLHDPSEGKTHPWRFLNV